MKQSYMLLLVDCLLIYSDLLHEKVDNNMAKLIDCNLKWFLQHVHKKRIIAFSAGRKFLKFVSDFKLERRIEFVIDNDDKKQGTVITINDVKIEIENIEKLLEYSNRDYIILISNLASYAYIMRQLNQYNKLQNIECYSVALMQDRCKKEEVIYTGGVQKIPKTIHYCWFGGNPIPDYLCKYMESWKRYCPDYEIIRWDETNYNVEKNSYMKEAYECKKWGFVSDYARLDIIAECGGIYLDTDVEIIKSFDDLLNDKSFFGFTNYNEINLGSGFGSVADNEFILELRDSYNGVYFLDANREMNLTSCIAYQAPVFRKMGYKFCNQQQNINNNVVYPVEVFNPKGVLGMNNLFTSNTHSIHHAARTWETEKNNRDYYEGRQLLKDIEIEYVED